MTKHIFKLLRCGCSAHWTRVWTNALLQAKIPHIFSCKPIVFIACGINHKTAPIHLRERLSIHDTACRPFIHSMMALPEINELAVLSTCNRTELYCEISHQDLLLEQVASHTQVPEKSLAEHWYAYTEQAGIKHALRVASGLDSMVIGESQIFGQFKQAYATACDAGSAKSALRTIFPFIFRASKRIRHESGITKHTTSLAALAARQILDAFPSHEDLNVLIIGTGEMAQLVAKYLSEASIQHFWIASRTEEHARELASKYQAQSLPITALSQVLPNMDVIITATACPFPFITKEVIEAAVKVRGVASQFFLDLALPRNVSEEISQFTHVTLRNIDDLKSQSELNLVEKQNAAALAEQLVEQELHQFIRGSQDNLTQQLISDYRSHMQNLAHQELSLALQQLKQGACESTLLQKLTHRLFQKLTHLPTLSLKQAALEGRTDILEIMQHLLTDQTSPYEIID